MKLSPATEATLGYTMTVIAALVVIALASCQLPEEPLPAEKNKTATLVVLSEVCNTYNSALRVLIPYKLSGHLSDSEIVQINEATEATASVCASDAPIPEDPLEAISQVNEKTATLLLMRERKGG